jgi:hypothetical protein
MNKTVLNNEYGIYSAHTVKLLRDGALKSWRMKIVYCQMKQEVRDVLRAGISFYKVVLLNTLFRVWRGLQDSKAQIWRLQNGSARRGSSPHLWSLSPPAALLGRRCSYRVMFCAAIQSGQRHLISSKVWKVPNSNTSCKYRVQNVHTLKISSCWLPKLGK